MKNKPSLSEPAISRIFIDKNGKLQKQYTPIEALLLKIYKGFMALPIMANAMMIALMIVETMCIVGFWQELVSDQKNGLGIYIFLIAFIGAILAVGTGFSWFLAERIMAKNETLVSNKKDNFLESELAAE